MAILLKPTTYDLEDRSKYLGKWTRLDGSDGQVVKDCGGSRPVNSSVISLELTRFVIQLELSSPSYGKRLQSHRY